MNRPPTSKPRVLYVTGPERDRLFAHFQGLFAGRSDVVVVLDRRFSQRRRVSEPAQGERRARERRRHGPAWIVPPA